MEVVGIICEYNPLHLGHQAQFAQIHARCGAECGIVCLMSGNYVQRGAPALLEKTVRAEAAVRSGADLVLELPVTAALSSAEGFAAHGVRILAPFCRYLCFGTESADRTLLEETVDALLSPAFPQALHAQLERGISFPAARLAALRQMGCTAEVPLRNPNDILAVEYCKAIAMQAVDMEPMPIFRPGGYHDTDATAEAPSATAVRARMLSGTPWQSYVPEEARGVLANAVLHTLDAGERAVLSVLRRMPQEAFAALPGAGEGLWRRFYRACQREPDVASILAAVKTKRYTHSRVQRMLLCAFLELRQVDLEQTPPYVRVLALNDRGRSILKLARETGTFVNLGQKTDGAYAALEQRCEALYGLFALPTPQPPAAAKQRVFYLADAHNGALTAAQQSDRIEQTS